MKEMHIPLEKFDLDEFIHETLKFLDNTVDHPTLAITWMEAPGRCPNDETDENWDFRSKLLKEDVYLFFPFAITDMEGSFDCADGHSYRHASHGIEELDEGQQEPNYEDQDELDESPFGDDIIGFMIRVENRTISITSAICAICGLCPGSKLYLLPDGGFLEKPLVDFIKGFVNADFEVTERLPSGSLNIEDFRLTTQESESRNNRQSIIGGTEMLEPWDLTHPLGMIQALIIQIMVERNLSEKDAERACGLTLDKQEHFQRFRQAILWNLDREKRWGKGARLSYSSGHMDLLVNATGMDAETIFDKIFDMVDDFLFFVSQTRSQSLDSPAMDEFGWREVALLKQFNLDYTKHFPSLASIACDILDSYPRPQESIRRMS